MLDIPDKDFKTAVISMFKELKETMFKELKERMMTMTHQVENINRDRNYVFKERTKWKSWS